MRLAESFYGQTSTRQKSGARGLCVYIIFIKVIAYRSNDQCIGSIQLDLGDYATVGGIFGFHKAGFSTVVLNRNTNLNNSIIDEVREFINKM